MKSDQQLWSKLKEGDKDSFAAIYETYATGLLAYGKRFTPNIELIEDCVHDLFVYIWKNRSGLSHTDSIQRYLLGSFRNNLLKAMKHGQKTTLGDDQLEHNFELELSVESSLIQDDTRNENKIMLQKAMEFLSKRQKEALYLKFFKRLENEEICEIMNINYQSLRNLTSSGIKRMREEIKKLNKN